MALPECLDDGTKVAARCKQSLLNDAKILTVLGVLDEAWSYVYFFLICREAAWSNAQDQKRAHPFGIEVTWGPVFCILMLAVTTPPKPLQLREASGAWQTDLRTTQSRYHYPSK